MIYIRIDLIFVSEWISSLRGTQLDKGSAVCPTPGLKLCDR